MVPLEFEEEDSVLAVDRDMDSSLADNTSLNIVVEDCLSEEEFFNELEG